MFFWFSVIIHLFVSTFCIYMFVTPFVCDHDSVSCCLIGCVLIVCLCVCVLSVHCVDSETSAVHKTGDTWLRWRRQRVEYCRCAGRERCHFVPVISECDMNAQTHKLTSTGCLVWLSFPTFCCCCNDQNIILCLSVCPSTCLPALTGLSVFHFTSNLLWQPQMIIFLLAFPRSRVQITVISAQPNEEPLGSCVSEWV